MINVIETASTRSMTRFYRFSRSSASLPLRGNGTTRADTQGTSLRDSLTR
jgi:hypothetical protein